MNIVKKQAARRASFPSGEFDRQVSPLLDRWRGALLCPPCWSWRGGSWETLAASLVAGKIQIFLLSRGKTFL